MTNSTFPQMLSSKLRDYCTLTKPEVNLLILMTTSAGYYLASHGPLNTGRLISTLVGTLLVAIGTATLNQGMERVWDGKMRRTASRPLPSEKVRAREAFVFGTLFADFWSVFPGIRYFRPPKQVCITRDFPASRQAWVAARHAIAL